MVSTPNSDRRRRKYHTDYIDSLESRAARLEQLIGSLTGDSSLRPQFLARLDGLQKQFSNENNITDIDVLIRETANLQLTPERESEWKESNVFDISSGDETTSVVCVDDDGCLVIKDMCYQREILEAFQSCYAIHSPALLQLVSDLETIDYNSVTSPTLKLFFNVVLGIGSLYLHQEGNSSHLVQSSHFIAAAKDSLMTTISRSKVDIHLLLSIHLLSCYELMQNRLSQSYLFDSISCSLTQHMGLHISYENRSSIAPKQSPFNLAVLWTIALHDRIITSILEVPCVIHFKRIISPFYQVVSNNNDVCHLNELLFSYVSRLWYIYDRFADQILTVKFDIGDSNNKLKLLSMGLKTLDELQKALPMSLSMETLDGSSDDFYKLVFEFNYKFSILKLNQVFKRDNDNNSSNMIKRTILLKTIECGDILSQLQKTDAGFIKKLPCYFVNFINYIAVNCILVLSGIKTNLKVSQETIRKFESCLDVCRLLLVSMAKIYRSAGELLNGLVKLGIRLHVSFGLHGMIQWNDSLLDGCASVPTVQEEDVKNAPITVTTPSNLPFTFTDSEKSSNNDNGKEISSNDLMDSLKDIDMDSFKDIDQCFQDWQTANDTKVNEFPKLDMSQYGNDMIAFNGFTQLGDRNTNSDIKGIANGVPGAGNIDSFTFDDVDFDALMKFEDIPPNIDDITNDSQFKKSLSTTLDVEHNINEQMPPGFPQ